MEPKTSWRQAAMAMAIALFSTQSHAFDPWEGAEPGTPGMPTPATARTLPAPVRTATRSLPTPRAIPPIPTPVAVIVPPAPPTPQTAPVVVASATPAPLTPLPSAARIAPDSIIAPPPPFLEENPATATQPPITLASAAPAAAKPEPLLAPTAPAPATVPTPAAAIAPAPQAPALASITVAEAPPIATQAIPVTPVMPEPTSPTRRSSTPADRFSLGLETFHDRYREDSVDLDNTALYASLTGDYTTYYTPNWFSVWGGRMSYGSNDYRSQSGKADSIPQWELEARAQIGYDEAIGEGHLKPYIGLGVRYFRDEAQGESTDLGFSLYDREILQVYAPVGVTYAFPAFGFTLAPTLEYGPLLYGRVNSKLGQVPGYYDTSNKQTSGYEFRGDFLVSNLDPHGQGFAFGPFFRYWRMGSSDVDVTPSTPSGTNWIEPENSRLQIGAQVKYLF